MAAQHLSAALWLRETEGSVMRKLGMSHVRSEVREWQNPLPGSAEGEVIYEITAGGWVPYCDSMAIPSDIAASHQQDIAGLDRERVVRVLELFEENRHRFRESVIVIVRSSDLADLTDAGLGLIKRKVLEKTNRALGKPLLKDVVFSEFSLVEH